MNVRLFFYLLALCTLFFPWSMSNANAKDQASNCKTWPTDEAALRNLLGRRAVEAAYLAAQSPETSDQLLVTQITADAKFSLGSGDVGRSLGEGTPALRELISELHADWYSFDGLDYMSRTVDPCLSHEVTIEFSSRKLSHRAAVKFRFIEGKIVGGSGWLMSTTSGAFPIAGPSR